MRNLKSPRSWLLSCHAAASQGFTAFSWCDFCMSHPFVHTHVYLCISVCICVRVTLGIQRVVVVYLGICRPRVLSERNYDFYWKRKCHPVVSEVRKVCLTSGFSSRKSRRPSRDVRLSVPGTYSTALITSYLPSSAPLPQNIQSVFLLTLSSGVVKTFRIYKLVSTLTAKKNHRIRGVERAPFDFVSLSKLCCHLARSSHGKMKHNRQKNVWLTTLIPEENPG